MKFLTKMRDDYAASDEPDWRVLKALSSYPELIGKKHDDVVPPFGLERSDAPLYFLRCGCGMLMGTSKDYAGDESVCTHCAASVGAPSASPRGEPRAQMTPRIERQIRLGLIVFVLMAAVMVGTSVSNGGSRPEPPMRALD